MDCSSQRPRTSTFALVRYRLNAVALPDPLYKGTQVRYGAGTLVSSSAEALSDMIETQEKCKKPLSVIVEGMGGRVQDKNSKSADILANPFDVFRVHYWVARSLAGIPPSRSGSERGLLRKAQAVSITSIVCINCLFNI